MVLIELLEVARATNLPHTLHNDLTKMAYVEVELNWTSIFDALERSVGVASVSDPVKALVGAC